MFAAQNMGPGTFIMEIVHTAAIVAVIALLHACPSSVQLLHSKLSKNVNRTSLSEHGW